MAPDLVSPLVGWYRESARELPWRGAGATPWEVLVSEIMLQQTPVARVEPVYKAWLARWPTPADLAADSARRGGPDVGQAGLPASGAAAARVRTGHRGPPRRRGALDVDALLTLPGIGAYTARAVAVFAFGVRAPVVDTNVRRVVARAVLGQGDAGPPSTARDLAVVEELLPPDPALAAEVQHRAHGTRRAGVHRAGAAMCGLPTAASAPGGRLGRRPTPGRPSVRSASPGPIARSAGY